MQKVKLSFKCCKIYFDFNSVCALQSIPKRLRITEPVNAGNYLFETVMSLQFPKLKINNRAKIHQVLHRKILFQ